MHTLEEILHEAEKLPRDQCMKLIELLGKTIGNPYPATRPSWEQYAGSAPYPLCREDAQQWVSQGRMETDTARRGE